MLEFCCRKTVSTQVQRWRRNSASQIQHSGVKCPKCWRAEMPRLTCELTGQWCRLSWERAPFPFSGLLLLLLLPTAHFHAALLLAICFTRETRGIDPSTNPLFVTLSLSLGGPSVAAILLKSIFIIVIIIIYSEMSCSGSSDDWDAGEEKGMADFPRPIPYFSKASSPAVY